MTISSLQLKLSLSADGMSFQSAADKFGTNKSQISDYISTGVGLSDKIINAMEKHFKSVGHEYIGETGLNIRTEYTYTLTGTDGFRAFMDEVYEAACDATDKQKFCIFNVDPDLIVRWVGGDWYAMHRRRMMTVKDNIDFQVIVEEGTTSFIGRDFVEYRYWPQEETAYETVYVYGNRTAFISPVEKTVEVRINVGQKQADVVRCLFQTAWEKAEKITI